MDDGRQQACQQWAAALRGSASGGTLGPSVRSEDMWQEVVQGTYLVRVVSAVCRAAVSARRYGSAFYEEMPVIAQVGLHRHHMGGLLEVLPTYRLLRICWHLGAVTRDAAAWTPACRKSDARDP